ncbi:flagellin [Acidiphilium acidophilum]|uniref:flagellin N-terminal helical domain-containing protein n=1 Tax=Acidiphilium acidophilum TaxID=76588 RepID=UPI002E8E66BF|nr:flagellin [Acidiphilium acidophilum]
MSAIGSILSNSGALAALNGIASAQNANNTYENQLSSGLSINSPSDNPAGFITAQGFTSQVNGITQASSNANEGISLLQTAQGAVQQQLNVAQNLNSIAVQAANGTQTPQEAQSLQGVVSQLTGQITSIANQTQFNNINLLDGTFTGVQFQIGANEGQTLSLSISSTTANSIGLNSLKAGTAAASAIYGTASGDSAAVLAAGTATASTGNAFAAGTLTVNGSNGSAKVTTTASESAASIATAVNALTNQTNVSAQATTNLVVAATGGAGGSYNFTLSNGTSTATKNAVNISATGTSGLISAINNQTAKTGITATKNSSGNVVLNQSSGQNIAITGVTQGIFTVANSVSTSNIAFGGTTTGTTFTAETAGATLVAQGKVSFQSDQSFSVAGASNIGLASQSNLTSLSSINVSTTQGANLAINVVKFSIQGLNNLGGQLGASQQRLQATLNNLTTTNTNLQNGLATIQDANIPQVSQNLTQSQIQAQAGVAALKSSSTLQQAYLSLLP